MSQLEEVRNDVVLTASIELERVFTVLTNVYYRPQFRDHARLIPHVEARFKAAVEELRQTPVELLMHEELPTV